MINQTSQVLIESENNRGDRRISPLKRIKFDLLAEKAKLEVKMKLHSDYSYTYHFMLQAQVNMIDQAIELINDQLTLGKV